MTGATGEGRFGFDAGKAPLEEAVRWAAESGFAFVEFSVDGPANAPAAWTGDRVMDTLLVQLRDRELPVECDGLAIIVNEISVAAIIPHLRALAAQGPADAAQLAAAVANKLTEKHHGFLSEELLSIDFASSRLDTDGAWHAAVRLASQLESE